MSEKKQKVPKLRFPGFTGEWEQRKLGEILKVNSGKDYKHLEIGDIPVYGTGGYMLSVNEALSEVDAIGIGRKGTIDKPQYLKAPFWTVDTLFYLVPLEEYSCSLLYHLSNLIPWKKFDESTGVPSLSKSTIDGIQVNIPKDKKEQDTISKLFDRINNLITLHQRKLENLKLKKKALLQKLFPKNGEQFPELRFPGFTDAWEQRKLGEVVKSYSGGTPTASNKEYYGGDIPFIRSAEINSDMTELYITQKGLDNSSAKMVEKGTILYAMYGATSGEVGISKINGAINQAILAMIPSGYNSKIIAQYLRKNKESIIGKYLQGGQGNLSANIILDLPIQLPRIEESNQIANFLESFDNLITLHQRKLEHLQLQKKALLQQMFV